MYGIPRDPDMTAALAQLEEEENEGHPDDEKPKVWGCGGCGECGCERGEVCGGVGVRGEGVCEVCGGNVMGGSVVYAILQKKKAKKDPISK